jgi:hypothetical protein
MKEKVCFFVMVGFAVLLGVVLLSSSADRASAMPCALGQETISIMAGSDENGSKHYVYVIDPKELRLCVYTMKGDGKLHYVAGRNLVHDMQIPYDFISKGKYVSPKEIEKGLGKKSSSGKGGK